jgi:hypothetical protein
MPLKIPVLIFLPRHGIYCFKTIWANENSVNLDEGRKNYTRKRCIMHSTSKYAFKYPSARHSGRMNFSYGCNDEFK